MSILYDMLCACKYRFAEMSYELASEHDMHCLMLPLLTLSVTGVCWSSIGHVDCAVPQSYPQRALLPM